MRPLQLVLGHPSSRLALARAVDHLAESARRAGRPGLIWIAGFFYPSLILLMVLVRGVLGALEGATEMPLPLFLPGYRSSEGGAGFVASLLPQPMREHVPSILALALLAFAFRLMAGLAHVSEPSVWRERCGERRTCPLAEAWRAGRGLSISTCGLWVALVALALGSVFVLIGPVVLLWGVLEETWSGIPILLVSVPLWALTIAYGVVLSVLNQLALHSLARNDRGVASALIHAWRLVRVEPGSAVRATLGDVVLQLSVLGLGHGLFLVLGAPAEGAALRYVWNGANLMLLAFLGVARAGYWARVYRALGGLAPTDLVPGLATARARATATAGR